MPVRSITVYVTALPVVLLAGATTGWSLTSHAAATATPAPATAGRVITLDDAIRFTREGNLFLRAAGQTADAARARTRNAGSLANPALTAALDNVGGSLGTDRAESSLLIEQLLELGGDRAARAGLAGAMATLSIAEQAQLERTLEGETVERFCNAWVHQQRVKQLRQAEHLAERAIEAAEERLKAGAAPASERVRAQGFRSLRQIERRRAEAELAVARRRLALQWSADSASFDSLSLPEPGSTVTPPLDTLLARLETHPGVQRAVADSMAESWRVREAQASRIPDLQLAGGVRHLAEADGTGFAVGLSLPLRLWNSGRGALDAAEAEHTAAGTRLRQVMLELRGELAGAHGRNVAAVSAWQGIRDGVRPAAEEALRLVVGGYRSGRLGYLEIQEGQRSLLEADLLLIEAAADVWRTRKALERLAGVPLDSVVPVQEGR